MAGPPPVPGGGRSEEERERARLEREARRSGRESTDSNPVVTPRTAGGRRGLRMPGGRKDAAPVDGAELTPFDDDTYAPDVDDDTFAFDDPDPRPSRKEAKAARKKEEQRQQLRQRAASSGSHKRVSELRAARQTREPGSSVGRRRIFVAVVGIVGIFVIWFLLNLFQPFAGDGGKQHRVTIKAESGLDDIADTLSKNHIIDSPFFFKLRATLSGHRGDLKPGTYTLREGESYENVLDTLSKGIVVKTINVTVPEGRARTELSGIVKQAGLKGNYTKATKKSKLLDPADYGGKKAKNLEGFLFPATYTLKTGSSVEDLVAKQLAAFKQNFAAVNLRAAKKKNLTGYDVLTIASLIEREAQVPRERKLIASVIYNRLKAGMPLQIDASIRFATNNWEKPISASDLRINSPYNLYRFKGLPPGPIASPGLASIHAAAAPAKTNYIYYVVKPNTCGEHTFSSTAAGFEKARAAYETARQKNGGRAPTKCP